MAAPAKFMFDLDFSAPSASRERAASPAEIAARVAEAEARAYRAGIEAGRHEAVADIEKRQTVALESVGQSLRAVAVGIGDVQARMETEAVEVAVAVARKLCTDLLAQEPLGEITALVRDCFRNLVAPPHIVVRVAEALYEPAKNAIERLARQSGYEGRLVILAEPEIATGDCRIEWADGGMVREREAIEARIAELVERYIASRGVRT